MEQFAFLHEQGSSHGASRIFRHAYEDPSYVQLCLAADEGWQALEHDAADKLLYRTGGLDIGGPDNEALDRIEAALESAGRPGERLSAGDVNSRFPAYRLRAGQSALYQQDAGILDAHRCLAALQRQAARRGAELLEETAAHRIEARDDHVTVSTHRGDFTAERLVVTAGAWLGRLMKDLKLPLTVEQQQVLYVRVRHIPDFSIGAFPLFIHRDSYVYGLPVYERPNCIKVSDHAGAPRIDLEKRRTELMKDRAADTIDRLGAFVPGAGKELAHYQLCLYTKTPDEHFILDRHPEHANIVIGGGFSGHGFKFGPILGDILAELSSNGTTRHDIRRFSVNRLLSRG